MTALSTEGSALITVLMRNFGSFESILALTSGIMISSGTLTMGLPLGYGT